MDVTSEEDARADAETFAERWIAQSLDVTPLTEDDRRRVVDGMRRLYHSQGARWPDHVVWVSSPRELATAADSSRALITQWLKRDPIRWAEYRQARRRRAGLSLVRAMIGALVFATTAGLTIGRIGGMSIIVGFVLGLTAAKRSFRRPDDRRRMEYEEVFGPEFLYRDALRDKEYRSITVHPLIAETADRMDLAVDEALAGVWDRIWFGWHTVNRLLSGVSQVFTFTRRLHKGRVGQIWLHRGGHLKLLDIDLDVVEGLDGVQRAFGWIAYRSLTLICEPPLELHTERLMGAYHLHNTTGPAIVWGGATEDKEYYLHGVCIPEHLFLAGVTVQDLHAESDAVVRAMAIERMGWLKYADLAGLPLFAAVRDPVDDLAEFRLYDLPEKYYEPSRVLIRVRDVGRTERSSVGAFYVRHDNPIEAFAGQYGFTKYSDFPYVSGGLMCADILLLPSEAAAMAPVSVLELTRWQNLPPTGVELAPYPLPYRGSYQLFPADDSPGVFWHPASGPRFENIGYLYVPPNQGAYLIVDGERDPIRPGGYALYRQQGIFWNSMVSGGLPVGRPAPNARLIV